MGNTPSSDKKSLEHIINYLAAQYITKDDFKNMINLNQTEYCDKVLILTSKIFKQYLNPSMIEYLAVKKGVDGENIIKKDKILAIQKDTLDKINVKDGYKRERLCIGIAKFYIQIAHIFSAISSTLNPQYKFKDIENNEVEQSILDRDNLPNYNERILTRNNLCSNRLKILLGSMDYNDLLEDTTIKINPNFCDININDKQLEDEPGIPELKQLYYDKYNYNTANFDDMTSEMKIIYEKDLKIVFEQFSNGDEKFDSEKIKNFSDIKLKNFHNSKGCQSGLYKEKIVGSTKKFLFKKYIENIKEMVENIKNQNNELIKIIDKIFVFSVDSYSGDKKVLINPLLNNDKLSQITKDTKETIIKLYTNCEKHFIEGLEIYEALIKKLKLETTKSQINNLKQEIDNKIPGTDSDSLNSIKPEEEAHTEDELEKETHTEDGLEKETHTEDELEEEAHTEDELEKETHTKDELEKETHTEDGLEKETHTEDGLEKETHTEDGLEKETHTEDGLEPTSHMEHELEPTSHMEDGLEKEPHTEDGLEKEPHTEDGLEKEPHMEDGLEKEPHTEDGLEKEPHMEDELEPKSHTEDGLEKELKSRIKFIRNSQTKSNINNTEQQKKY
jgi:hypothetical protein